MKYFYPLSEYARPWKLLAFAAGMAFLLMGAAWSGLPDWDFAVSFLMAVPAYFTAAPTLRVVFERRWQLLPLALACAWLTVDGIYVIYWSLVNPVIVEELRHANAAASSALYIMCGLVWYPKMSTEGMVERYLLDEPDDWLNDEYDHH